jgi:hypothetical protein
MRLINFVFNKISIEKFKDNPQSIKFNTKIDIVSIDSIKSDFLKMKEELLKVDFVYSVQYEPELAKLELAGTVVLSVEPRIAREVLKGWKEKETSEEFRIFMFNIILRKSNLKSLELEEDLGLTSHIPLPTLNKENMQEKKEE